MLDPYRGSGAATRVARAKLLTDLRGGGKVAVVGGRSGIPLLASFSPGRVSYEGRWGAMRDSGLRSAQGSMLYSALFPMVGILGLATALRAAITIIYYENCVRFVFGNRAHARPARGCEGS